MGMNMDGKERSKARTAEAMRRFEDVRLYNLAEVSTILNVSHRTLQRWLATGKMKATKIGGKWKVSEETLRALINGES